MRTRLLALGIVLSVLGSTYAGDSIPAWAANRDERLPKSRAEHLAFLGVPDWHDAGVRGKGIKVAVIDSGFRGYKAQLGK